jgi:hypothetical protein
MTDEYNLKGAGFFTVEDLLDFQHAESEKGLTVRKIWITPQQANNLVNDFADLKTETTGKKLVDFWNAPVLPIEIETLHGIQIGIEL